MEKNTSKWDYEDEDTWYGNYGYGYGANDFPVTKTEVTRSARRIHEKPLSEDKKDVMVNGASINDDDWYGMTQEEVFDTVSENPMGTAEWVYDIIYDGNKKVGK
jgi:hypothetical protein